MYKFNNTSITTLYIKQLLKDFNLPTFAIFKPGMMVYKGAFYLYNNTIASAKKTGKVDEFTVNNFNPLFDGYTFGQELINLTKNLKINSLEYDSYTHEYLGEYLRFYRDYYGIDLMPLYNCNSNSTVSSFSINYQVKEPVVEDGETKFKFVDKTFSDADGSKIYVIPVKPFTKYTVCVDSNTNVELIAGYYHNGIINVLKETNYEFNYGSTYLKVNNSSFNKPFVYDRLMEENIFDNNWPDLVKERLYNQRENLKLFIKVPASNMVNKSSTLVVLEGDFKTFSETFFNKRDKYLTCKETIKCDASGVKIEEPKQFFTKLGLMNLQSYVQYPFSDRLLEYLYNSAITNNDEIDNNISKLQNRLFEVCGYTYTLDGVWDDRIKDELYKIATDKNIVNNYHDILGYCDKEMETAIVLGE